MNYDRDDTNRQSFDEGMAEGIYLVARHLPSEVLLGVLLNLPSPQAVQVLNAVRGDR